LSNYRTKIAKFEKNQGIIKDVVAKVSPEYLRNYRLGESVPLGNLLEHLRESDSQREDRADVEIFVRCLVEKNIEAGFETVFRQPVTYHDWNFREGVKNHGYI